MTNDARNQVLAAIDLVELVSQTVALKRTGRVFKGLCPFHQEKTPSFQVDPAKQFFYCYGCKAGGTVFDFVMKRDRVEFKEALEILARQAGIELERHSGSGKPGQRQLLLDVHSAAARIFEMQLHGPPGAAAREYLEKRGFTPETIKKWGIGLAVDAWDALAKGPLSRKFSMEVLATAGLVKPRQNGDGFYDTFRNRIMFPIRNEGGQTIAFGGRIAPGSSDPAKYLNSPETPLFTKGKAMFGLDLARQRIVETRTAAVVEGYTDVIMAHQFGATNLISPLGTALTPNQLAILRRFADRIVLVFDPDTAGNTAVSRAIDLALTQGGSSAVNIGIVTIPEELDPDEFFLKHGAAAFDQLLATAADALEYAWNHVRSRAVSGQEDFAGEQKAIAEYLDLFARARAAGGNELAWLAAIKRVSKLVGILPEELNARLRPARSAQRRAASPPAQEETAPSQPASRGLKENPTALEVAERQLLGVLLLEPERWQSVQLSIGPEDFTEPQLRQLAEVYWEYQRHEGEPVLSELLAHLPDATLIPIAVELTQRVEELGDTSVTLFQAMSSIKLDKENQRLKRLVSKAVQAQGEAEGEQALRALQEAVRRPDVRRGGLVG